MDCEEKEHVLENLQKGLLGYSRRIALKIFDLPLIKIKGRYIFPSCKNIIIMPTTLSAMTRLVDVGNKIHEESIYIFSFFIFCLNWILSVWKIMTADTFTCFNMQILSSIRRSFGQRMWSLFSLKQRNYTAPPQAPNCCKMNESASIEAADSRNFTRNTSILPFIDQFPRTSKMLSIIFSLSYK